MYNISKETLEKLRKEYPAGCRVELVKMDDPYRTDLVPGCRGTVEGVDDSGSIHVRWDVHSSLAVIYGVDACKKLDSVKTVCYGEGKHWDDRKDAINFFAEGMVSSEGSEKDRYATILSQLLEGETVCSDGDEPRKKPSLDSVVSAASERSSSFHVSPDGCKKDDPIK